MTLITFVCGCFLSAFSQTDKRIEEIRKAYQEADRRIAECEESGETATTFLTEIVVNKNNGPYPAVGIYRTSIKFYYTFGDREENPYPDHLLKITVTTKRSAVTEYSEFLFGEKDQLIFYFGKNADAERRIYFESERPLKILHGEEPVPVGHQEEAEFVKSILKEKVKLSGIFKNSLQF